MCSKYLLPERRVEFSSSITEAAGWNQKGSYHTSPVASVRAADPSWRGNGAAGEGGRGVLDVPHPAWGLSCR